VPELKEGKNTLEFFIPSAVVNIPGLKLLKEVKVVLTVHKNNEKLLLNGTVAFEAEFSCAWCAESFTKSFMEKFGQEYFHGGFKSADQPLELVASELNREFYNGETIDILPLVRDTILLAVPIAPVCRADCKGLCPICGTNLNTNQCSCVGKEPSEWQQSLAKLKERL
jgi:uncharacterized protein